MSIDEQEYQQDEDALRRVDSWLNTLEQRITVLLQANDPQALRPGEREQAVSRHLAMALRLLQWRQKLTQGGSISGEQAALLDALLHDVDDP